MSSKNFSPLLSPARLRASMAGMAVAALLSLAAALPASAASNRAKLPPAGSPPPAIGQAIDLTIGKSTLLRLPGPVERVSVGDPGVADVTLVGSSEIYLLGKSSGTTNLMLWRRQEGALIVDVTVGLDVARLQARLHALLPGEPGIRVGSAADTVVLSGEVSSAQKVSQAMQIAEAFVRGLHRSGRAAPSATEAATPAGASTSGDSRGGGAAGETPVVNLMQVAAPQQVMLEVKVAEVSKTLLDKLGSEFGMTRTNGSWTYSIVNSLLSGGAGLLTALKSPDKFIKIDAEKQDGLVRILAEPNIIAISGQEGSFLAGGKIFIPVARANPANGFATITLEEKEFGVGLKFTPVVLDGGAIQLRVAPEVSELSQTGSPFTSVDGTTAILPSFTTRRAQTTVQLGDGQSFAIAGLIKNNVAETVKRMPVFGEVPILGALFRSAEFQTNQTELMFIVTPRLVKPLTPLHGAPGDNFVPPTRGEFFLEGKLEGNTGMTPPGAVGTPPAPLAPPPATVAPPAALPAPARGGFETR